MDADHKAKEDRAVARWALRTRDSCKELRMLDFVGGAGVVQVRSALQTVLFSCASTSATEPMCPL